MPEKPTDASGRLYEVKVTLQPFKPLIWRRFLVRDDTTLAQLHSYLQAVMGWTNSHLHHFFVDRDTYFGPPDPEFPRRQNERNTRVGDLLRKPGDRLMYEYDFGDGWEHEIVLERVLSPPNQAPDTPSSSPASAPALLRTVAGFLGTSTCSKFSEIPEILNIGTCRSG